MTIREFGLGCGMGFGIGFLLIGLGLLVLYIIGKFRPPEPTIRTRVVEPPARIKPERPKETGSVTSVAPTKVSEAEPAEVEPEPVQLGRPETSTITIGTMVISQADIMASTSRAFLEQVLQELGRQLSHLEQEKVELDAKNQRAYESACEFWKKKRDGLVESARTGEDVQRLEREAGPPPWVKWREPFTKDRIYNKIGTLKAFQSAALTRISDLG